MSTVIKQGISDPASWFHLFFIIFLDRTVLNSLDEKVVHSLLDEVIYKLSAFNDAEIGAAATRALVNISSIHQPLIRLLYTRYKWVCKCDPNPNTTKGTSCLLMKKLRFMQYLTEDLTSFPMIPNSWKLKWYFWKKHLQGLYFLLFSLYFALSE